MKVTAIGKGEGGGTWEQGLPNSEEYSVIVLVAAVQACDEMHQYGHMKPTYLATVFASSLGTAKIHKETSPHVSARKLRTLCTPLFIVLPYSKHCLFPLIIHDGCLPPPQCQCLSYKPLCSGLRI